MSSDTTPNIAMGETGGCGCSQNGGKRKLSAYNIFMKKELRALKKSYPGKKAAELMKMAAKKWRSTHPKKSSSSTSRKPSTRKSRG